MKEIGVCKPPKQPDYKAPPPPAPPAAQAPRSPVLNDETRRQQNDATASSAARLGRNRLKVPLGGNSGSGLNVV